jgi:endonuclease III
MSYYEEILEERVRDLEQIIYATEFTRIKSGAIPSLIKRIDELEDYVIEIEKKLISLNVLP